MQVVFYRSLHSQLPSSSNLVLLQFDYAENYLCSSQDAISAAYYHQSQVTVFTAVLWTAERTMSCVVASDNLRHDKSTAVAHIVILLQALLPPGYLTGKKLVFFSDGPRNQFKNKYMLATLPHFRHCFQLNNLQWSFFAASHGKGPCDGIGGNAKRMVREAVRCRKVTSVTNAKGFHEVICASGSVIKSILCTPLAEEDALNAFGAMEVFASAPTATGISEDHHWLCDEHGTKRKRVSLVPVPPKFQEDIFPPPFPVPISVKKRGRPLKVKCMSASSQLSSNRLLSQSPPPPQQGPPPQSSFTPPRNTAIGEFVVVQVKGTQKQRQPEYYVGMVIEWSEDESGWLIKCMRRVIRTNPSQFSFPDKEDVALYSLCDIVAHLSLPKIVGKRNIYHFHVLELTPFVNSLH